MVIVHQLQHYIYINQELQREPTSLKKGQAKNTFIPKYHGKATYYQHITTPKIEI